VPVDTAEIFAGLPCQRLTLPCGDSVLVALHGAHVLSWTVGGVEQLYLSPRAVMDGQTAIRGGVPICFPQFNQRGTLPKHGFARNLPWNAEAATCEGAGASIKLHLSASEATRRIWPQAFEAFLSVALAPGALHIALNIKNVDQIAMVFSGALHTYLAVDDISRTQLLGLGGQAQWDALTDTHSVAVPTLEFSGEFDRVFEAAQGDLTLRCGQRVLSVSQSSSWANTVVWNPGAQRCGELSDMPADGYAHMLCVEAAQVMEPITVGPGQTWQGWQRLVSTIGAC